MPYLDRGLAPSDPPFILGGIRSRAVLAVNNEHPVLDWQRCPHWGFDGTEINVTHSMIWPFYFAVPR
jgi:hypothetical protein